MKNKRLIEELENLKINLGINFEVLSDEETKEYQRLWVNTILPKNSNKETRQRALNICVSSGKCNKYLWHIFSYDIIKSSDNPTEEFNKANKNNCVLVFQDNKFIAVKLTNAKRLTEQNIIHLCNTTAGWCDFVITADDFSWTYARTHEDGWLGPYFYRMNNNHLSN
ncbi:MAG: DUF4275 family protein [Clostridium sp.]|nr:DUF4275 family protein [Clostridium sp.]